jgi:hypothetical protein
MTFEQMRDEWEIQKLSHRYAQLVDRGDSKAWASLFTPDGVLRVGDGMEVGLDVIEGIPGASSGAMRWEPYTEPTRYPRGFGPSSHSARP